MAVVERFISQDGTEDYTSIEAWLADTDIDGGNDIWKGVIVDASVYEEDPLIEHEDTGSREENEDGYVWLTTAGDGFHGGDINGGAALDGALDISSSYVRISDLRIKGAIFVFWDWGSTGLRPNHNIFERLIIDSRGISSASFSLDSGHTDENVSISNSLLFSDGGSESGFLIFTSDLGGDADLGFEFINLTIHNYDFEGLYMEDSWSGPNNNGIHVYNVVSVGNGDIDFEIDNYNNVNGSNNVDSDGSLQTTNHNSGDGIDDDSFFNEDPQDLFETPGSDYTPKGVLLGNGTHISTSFLDSRVDLSLDVAGNPRDSENPTIGAYQEEDAEPGETYDEDASASLTFSATPVLTATFGASASAAVSSAADTLTSAIIGTTASTITTHTAVAQPALEAFAQGAAAISLTASATTTTLHTETISAAQLLTAAAAAQSELNPVGAPAFTTTAAAATRMDAVSEILVSATFGANTFTADVVSVTVGVHSTPSVMTQSTQGINATGAATFSTSAAALSRVELSAEIAVEHSYDTQSTPSVTLNETLSVSSTPSVTPSVTRVLENTAGAFTFHAADVQSSAILGVTTEATHETNVETASGQVYVELVGVGFLSAVEPSSRFLWEAVDTDADVEFWTDVPTPSVTEWEEVSTPSGDIWVPVKTGN
jgi:hypothetical protein